MGTDRVVIVGTGESAKACHKFFTEYGFSVPLIISNTQESAVTDTPSTTLEALSDDRLSAMDCPLVFASDDLGFQAILLDRLKRLAMPEGTLIRHAGLYGFQMKRLIDLLSFNHKSRPNEYVQSLLENYPKSGHSPIPVLASCVSERIKRDLDPKRKTIAVFYENKFYRGNLGSPEMYEKIRNSGYNVIFLFGAIGNDEFEQQEYSYYAGHGIAKHLDFIDLAITPIPTPKLPESAKVLFIQHDIYHASPREVDYHFMSTTLHANEPLVLPDRRDRRVFCKIPGGYMKLDRNIRYFQTHPVAADSIIYAVTSLRGKDNQPLPYVSLPEYGEEIVGALLDTFGDYRVILRPHPNIHPSDRAAYVDPILDAFSDNPRLVYDANPGFYMDQYCRSALMVSDVSGTAFTFAFSTLRPVVFFAHDETAIQQDYGPGSGYYSTRDKVGLVAATIDELKEKVALALEKRDEFAENIRACRDSLFFNVGRSEDYLAENIHYIAEGKMHPDWQYVASQLYCGQMESSGGHTAIWNAANELLTEVQPQLLERAYKRCNILSHNDKFYAFVHGVGPLDLSSVPEATLAELCEEKKCFISDSLDEVKQLVDRFAPIPPPMLVEEGYRKYNILAWKDRFYAIAQATGPMDLTDADESTFAELQERGVCVTGDSLEEAKRRVDEFQTDAAVAPADRPVGQEEVKQRIEDAFAQMISFVEDERVAAELTALLSSLTPDDLKTLAASIELQPLESIDDLCKRMREISRYVGAM